MTAQPTRDQLEAELDSWMTRAYEAEKRAWQAEHRITRLEAQTNIRGRAVVMYRERARGAEADRDWLLRSSRLAKEGRIKANARADHADARIKAVRDVLADYAPDEDVSSPVPADPIRRALDG